MDLHTPESNILYSIYSDFKDDAIYYNNALTILIEKKNNCLFSANTQKW